MKKRFLILLLFIHIQTNAKIGLYANAFASSFIKNKPTAGAGLALGIIENSKTIYVVFAKSKNEILDESYKKYSKLNIGGESNFNVFENCLLDFGAELGFFYEENYAKNLYRYTDGIYKGNVAIKVGLKYKLAKSIYVSTDFFTSFNPVLISFTDRFKKQTITPYIQFGIIYQ